jgi:hypothetical protein
MKIHYLLFTLCLLAGCALASPSRADAQATKGVAKTASPSAVGDKVTIHIVLFKFADTAKPQDIERLMKEIQALQEIIPGILDIRYGENFSSRAKGYTHAVVMRFTSRAALEAFYSHPAHKRLIETSIKPIIADLLPLDFEDVATAPQ